MEPKLSGYITAKTGYLKNAANDFILDSTVGLGGKIENNGYYAKAEGGYGTTAYAKAELGKAFSFAESGFGLDTSVGGQYTVSTRTKDYYHRTIKEGANSPTWKANDTRGYGKAALTYNSSALEVSLGVKAGVKTASQPSLEGITLANAGETRGTEYAGRTTKAFVEPETKFGVKLGKGWKIALHAAPSQGSLDLSLNF